MASPAKITIFFSLIIFAESRPSFDLSSLKIVLSHLSPSRKLGSSCTSWGITCDEFGRVTRIMLNDENLDGYISSEIGDLKELRELSLKNNRLVDRVPERIVDCRKLEILNLKGNRLNGDLKLLKHLKNLEFLDVSENLFSGKVPGSVKSLAKLRSVNDYGNKMLSRRNVGFPKRYILAETNKTSKGQSKNSSGSGKNSTTPRDSTEDDKKDKKKKKKNVKGWIIGFVSGLVAGIISGIVFSILYKLIMICISKREKETGPAIFSPFIKKEEHIAFLEKEDGLASCEIIGKGGCGEVYKTELPDGTGRIIAIKKIVQPAINAADLSDEESKSLNKKLRQVKSEIKTVGAIRHRNLLSLLAHISRHDCHYLVYEYMKNGSLQDVLKEVKEGTRELDWLTRHKIALGIAAGLEYLHHDHNPKVIHRDLKPGNILLDDDMEARIADFGLAKVVPENDTHMSTSNVAGTVGYIAPEFYQTHKITEMCDMFSFGVVLAVLVTGKLPSDEFFQDTEEMSQVKWLKNVLSSESPKRAIDPSLAENKYHDQMLLVAKIACFCTLDDPKQRPTSKEVRCMLMQIAH